MQKKSKRILRLVEKKTSHIEIKIIHHDKFFEHLHMKRTVIDEKYHSQYLRLKRIIKYTRYGFYPCRETKVKLVDKINKAES